MRADHSCGRDKICSCSVVGGLGRSRQKSKRASRLSIRLSCLWPGTPDWHANRTSLYDLPFCWGLQPFLVAERKMRLGWHHSVSQAFILTLVAKILADKI